MGQQFVKLAAKHQDFIAKQKIFFVGTATADSRVNVSPKGMDSLRVISETKVAWLNLTGSGNETSAHVQIDPRMTLMFCAFEGNPVILRLFGHAKVVHPLDPQWDALYALFPPLPGARQIFELTIDLVQTSCGMAVPRYAFVEERQELADWASQKGPEGIEHYWRQKNQKSLDDLPTHIVDKAIGQRGA